MHAESSNRTRQLLAENGATVADGILCLAHTVFNFLWLKIDTRPPYYNMAGHALATLRILHLPFFTDPAGTLFDLLTLNSYPPLVYWLAAPLGALFWPSADVLTAIYTLFLCVLIVSTYAVTRRLSNPRVGLLAAVLVSRYPLVYGLSREYLLDVPLTAVVTLSIALLLATRGVERGKVSLAFGVSLGLGLLIKWTFAFFLLAPVLIVLFDGVRQGSRRAWLHALLAAAVGAVIASPWYVLNVVVLTEFLRINSESGIREGDPLVGSLDSCGFISGRCTTSRRCCRSQYCSRWA